LRETQGANQKLMFVSYFTTIMYSCFSGPWTLTRQILATDGFRGMYRGLVPTLLRETPGYFFFFGGYELSRYMLTPVGKTKDEIGLPAFVLLNENCLGALRTILCGGIGGVILWTLMFPFDVIKSRVQVSGKGTLYGTLMEILHTDGNTLSNCVLLICQVYVVSTLVYRRH
jgi:solute carrier family 25 ornithine transporter 2/15